MSTQATSITHLDAALDAAVSLALSASLALEQQRQGQGLAPAAYRNRIRDIRDRTQCALDDLGQAKRMAVLARRHDMQQREKALLQYSESMLRELAAVGFSVQVLRDLAESTRNVLLAQQKDKRIREHQMVAAINRHQERMKAEKGGAA